MPSDSGSAAARVFVFAHQDDEFGVFAHIEALVARECPVWCVYLTDGTARGVSLAVRNAESVEVLTSLGVSRDRILFTGSSLAIRDGFLHERMGQAFAALQEVLRAAPVAALYVPAWEGGHQDHDCAHAVGLQAARDLGLAEVFQYPLYNGATTRGPWFSVMCPLASNGPVTEASIPVSAALRYIRACLTYRSQWRTWIGLLPFYAWKLLSRRSMPLQPCRAERALERPHAGPLYYERRFQVAYQTVARAVAMLEREARA